MNNLLIFFAFPVATILLSLVLQKVLNNPILVAITFFAIYLIVTYAIFDSNFLIFTIIYTILAYITATLTCIICNLIRKITEQENSNIILTTSTNIESNEITEKTNNNCNFCRCKKRM